MGERMDISGVGWLKIDENWNSVATHWNFVPTWQWQQKYLWATAKHIYE